MILKPKEKRLFVIEAKMENPYQDFTNLMADEDFFMVFALLLPEIYSGDTHIAVNLFSY